MATRTKKRSTDWRKSTIPMEFGRILITESGTHQSLFLREVEGKRELPIFISFLDAMGIERKIRKLPSRRPFTHDLLCEAVKELGGRFLDVHIYDFLNGIYFARIWIVKKEIHIPLESRPSDAIAIALTCRPPLKIYVEEKLLRNVP